MAFQNTRYVGPRTSERYAGKTGSAYVGGVWQPVTVQSMRKHHGRIKLTVVLPDTTTTEVTLNLYRESGSLSA